MQISTCPKDNVRRGHAEPVADEEVAAGDLNVILATGDLSRTDAYGSGEAIAMWFDHAGDRTQEIRLVLNVDDVRAAAKALGLQVLTPVGGNEVGNG